MQQVYHSGELAVQTRAGVQEMAARVGRSIRTELPPVAVEFLREQSMAVLGGRDVEDAVWASLLCGSPGFITAPDARTLHLATLPAEGDPLGPVFAPDRNGRVEVGMIAVEFATRRRMRVNGTTEAWESGIRLHARQVYSNCPKYIQRREFDPPVPQLPAPLAYRRPVLTADQQRWVASADTCFIATVHPGAGADASHRGGHPGFIEVVDARTLILPDYSGNTMFQTLGNLAADPRAGLLFIDFARGHTLQLTGVARVEWDPDRLLHYPGAERLVEFRLHEAVEICYAVPWRGRVTEYSPFNPMPPGKPPVSDF